MAKIPLNKFQRVSHTCTVTPSTVYICPIDRAAILLNVLATNKTADARTVTAAVSTATLNSRYQLAEQITIDGYDAASLTVNKVILVDGDRLILNSDSAAAVDVTVSILEAINT